MTHTSTQKSWGGFIVAVILLAGLPPPGGMVRTAQAQNFDGSGGGSVNVPSGFTPSGFTPPPQQPPPPSVFQQPPPPPGAIWQQQDADRQRAAELEQERRAAEARAAQARREEMERKVAAALQRAREEFEQGKRDTLAAMKGVGAGDGFKGLGGNTNFFSLKGFKPIPREALSTSLEEEKAQTSQCFDVGGCAPVALPPLHLGSPPALAAVPAWVQQTPQYQALAATLRQLQAQEAAQARALRAAQQALRAGPAEPGAVQQQVTVLQTQVADTQQQMTAKEQQMLDLSLQLQAERPAASGGAARR